MLHKTTRLLAVLPALSLALLPIGCGDEKVVEVVTEPAITVTMATGSTEIDTGESITVYLAVNRGVSYTINWSASGGEFVTTGPDSAVWLAPDTAGLYRIAATATDGDDVGIGKLDVAVATYLPEDSPFYVGASACALCHDGGVGGDEYGPWSASAHAGAWSALVESGQDGNAFCAGCHSVGTRGLDVDGSLNNGGYDETRVARLRGVQCENCHKPGSEHPGDDFGSVMVSIGAATCGDCHNGTHHPTFDEWSSSPHNEPFTGNSASGRASCAKCHNGLETARFLDDPEGYTNAPEDPAEATPLTCAGCHDPHGNENPGNLRDAAITDRALPNSVLVESAGAGRLCMACHNGRRSSDNVEDQLANGSGHFGPHHSNQGDMLAAVNAYEAINPDFTFRTSLHIEVEDACVTCHTHPHAGDAENGIATFTGHTFLPTVEACASCHGEITEFSDVLAKQDFDGDMEIEGVQDEIEGLLGALRQAIIDASPTGEAADSLEADFEHFIGDTLYTTRTQREAAYNWAFVSFDGSKGVHNTTYAVQLLQQSLLAVQPGGLPQAHILVE